MLVLLLLVGCLKATPNPAATSCAGGCHGDPATGAAPPLALGGLTERTDRGVGAHQGHVTGAGVGKVVACEECHQVPGETNAEGHIDTPWPAEVKWGPLAKTNDAFVAWAWSDTPDTDTDPTNDVHSCTVYCHGSADVGALKPHPNWTAATDWPTPADFDPNDPSKDVCSFCHGDPPPPPHPTGTSCNGCHSGFDAAGADHIDGCVDVFGSKDCAADTDTTPIDTDTTGDTDITIDTDTTVVGTCASSCHGSDTTEAPPPDTTGETATSARGVGAHAAHLSGGSSKPVVCTACHVVPATVGAAGHLDGSLPADVTFGDIADNGTTPTWNGTTCANTYCHGGTLDGGSNNNPVWTTVDGTQAACGSCHSVPPPSHDPSSTACEGCHALTAGPNQTIAHPERHIDGHLDFN